MWLRLWWFCLITLRREPPWTASGSLAERRYSSMRMFPPRST